MTPNGKTFRITFFGTPAFALPTLDALAGQASISLVVCVTQPDRPTGRHQTLTGSPVKRWAETHRIPVLQPEKIRTPDFTETLRRLDLDLAVIVAYSKIIPANLLAIPRKGWVNLHASLLPRWRGASPINHTILAGDEETGVTTMVLDEGLDTGPVLGQRRLPIRYVDSAVTLGDKLATIGADLLLETLLPYLHGKLSPKPQPKAGVTLAPKLDREAGVLDWGKSSVEIDRRVRAFTPWPGTSTTFRGKTLKILRGHILARTGQRREPGTVTVEADGTIAVQCGDELYGLDLLQLQDRKALPAAAFSRGLPAFIGSTLGG